MPTQKNAPVDETGAAHRTDKKNPQLITDLSVNKNLLDVKQNRERLLCLKVTDAEALRTLGFVADCFALHHGCVAALPPSVRFVIFDDLSQAAQRLADDVARVLPSAAVWRTFPEIVGLENFVSDLAGHIKADIAFDPDARTSRKNVEMLLRFAFPVWWNGGRR